MNRGIICSVAVKWILLFVFRFPSSHSHLFDFFSLLWIILVFDVFVGLGRQK